MIEIEIYAAGVRNLEKILELDHELEAVPGLRYKVDSNHDIVYLDFDEPTLRIQEIRAIFRKIGLDPRVVGADSGRVEPEEQDAADPDFVGDNGGLKPAGHKAMWVAIFMAALVVLAFLLVVDREGLSLRQAIGKMPLGSSHQGTVRTPCGQVAAGRLASASRCSLR